MTERISFNYGQLKNLNTSLINQAENIKKLQAALISPYLPIIRQMQEQLMFSHSNIKDQIEKIREQIIIPYSNVQKQIDRMRKQMSNPLSTFLLQIEDIQKRNCIDSNVLTDFYKRYREYFLPLTRILSNISKDEFEAYASQLIETMDSVAEDNGNFSYDSYEINSDGTIATNGSVYSVKEIQDEINLLVEDVTNNHNKLSFEKIIYSNFKLNAKEHPVLAFIFIYIIIPIFVNVCANILSDKVGLYNKEIKRNRSKIVQTVNAQINHLKPDKSFYKYYRFVYIDKLNVRVGRSRKTRVISVINFGQLVKVIKVKNDWALIECMFEEESICITGWVFVRYLKKFSYGDILKECY
jgi:hypothetical protein